MTPQYVFKFLFLAIVGIHQADAFSPSHKRNILTHHSMSVTSSSPPPIEILKVDPSTYGTGWETDEIMQVAAYRNNRTSVPQMIAQQQAKRDSYDSVASALDGVKIGLGIGVAFGIISALGAADDGGSLIDQVQVGLKNCLVFGGTTGALLGYNNYSGNRVYVMGEKEAINRLTVDFVASLKIGLDQGFVVRLEDKEYMDGKFEGCNGIVATLDCQLRNSKTEQETSVDGVKPKFYVGLPPHIHLKNMDVDMDLRRRGIASKLIEAVEEWGQSSTDAELLTLEVKNSNEAAIKLYEKCGFLKDDSRPTGLGLSFMSKRI